MVCKGFLIPDRGIKSAVDFFGSFQAFLEADEPHQLPYLTPRSLTALRRWKRTGQTPPAYAKALDAVAEIGGSLLCYTDDNYPELLRQIPDPPPVLFIQGDITGLLMPQIAIVGSRRCTAAGLRNAGQFAETLGAAGLTITSGLALGIDGAAHEGALRANARTVAVMATGIDLVYPARHQRLASQIIDEGGVLITEFLPGTKPLPGNFPRRNRIVTGLSAGLLVIEAGERSGSLISARLAADQGREVFALPGSIQSPVSAGCHQLIRQGATLVTEPSQIVEQLASMLGFDAEMLDSSATVRAASPKKTSTVNWLETYIDYDPVSLDELCDRIERSAAEVASALVELELNGVVQQTSYGYQRI